MLVAQLIGLGVGPSGAGATGAGVMGAGVVGADVVGAGVMGAGVIGAGEMGAGVMGAGVDAAADGDDVGSASFTPRTAPVVENKVKITISVFETG